MGTREGVKRLFTNRSISGTFAPKRISFRLPRVTLSIYMRSLSSSFSFQIFDQIRQSKDCAQHLHTVQSKRTNQNPHWCWLGNELLLFQRPENGATQSSFFTHLSVVSNAFRIFNRSDISCFFAALIFLPNISTVRARSSST